MMIVMVAVSLLLVLRGELRSSPGVVFRTTGRARGIDAVTVTPDPGDGHAAAVPSGCEALMFYRVETVRHWDDGVTPGITRLAFVAALPTVPAGRFRQRYEQHAAVARVQHPGICRYVQHFVVGGSEPVCAAVAELHFADETAMRERFYRDADSPAVVDADISDYLDRDRTWSLLARLVDPR
jgi:hypothetical protein